jgi:hypothetical protein
MNSRECSEDVLSLTQRPFFGETSSIIKQKIHSESSIPVMHFLMLGRRHFQLLRKKHRVDINRRRLDIDSRPTNIGSTRMASRPLNVHFTVFLFSLASRSSRGIPIHSTTLPFAGTRIRNREHVLESPSAGTQQSLIWKVLENLKFCLSTLISFSQQSTGFWRCNWVRSLRITFRCSAFVCVVTIISLVSTDLEGHRASTQAYVRKKTHHKRQCPETPVELTLDGIMEKSTIEQEQRLKQWIG